jgi:HK97 family phage prohead protease
MPRLDIVRSLPMTDTHIEGRTIEGQALRWDTLYRVSDDGRRFYQEGFRRGAFTQSMGNRGNWYELRTEHFDMRVGRVEFIEGDAGLNFRATFDYGDVADDELELVRAGKRSGVSIRYTPQHAEAHAPPWWRDRVDVRELSLTSRPQYGADAKVLAIRSVPSETDDALKALLDFKAPSI